MNRLLICLFIFINTYVIAQGGDVIWLHENEGQWDSRVLYKVDLQMGEMLIESDGFTYNLNDHKQVMSHSHHSHEKTVSIPGERIIRSQVIKTKFIKSKWNGHKTENINSTFYRNYFLGDDPSKWKTNVKSFQAVILKDFYPEIDLTIDGSDSKLEYSFLVKKNADPSKIRYEISGASGIVLKQNGNLSIGNRFGEIIESKPVAWNVINNKKYLVDVEFVVSDNVIEFNFPNGYDESYELIIDPSITFSTFSGSTADNWGMTSTPDNHSNLYAAGIIFNDGGVYPTTTGSFDETINGEEGISGFDVAISKFNEDGSELLFATYLGGQGNETPHSLVVDGSDNLYLLGATSSSDFPTSINSFDNSFNGGSVSDLNGLFFSASDVFVTKISSNGINLLGSTLIGGSGNDGLNTGVLNYNYGDSFRGEIIHGDDGFIYVSTTTKSTDFPTLNPFQSDLMGIQDAAFFKMRDDLSALSWSSFFGGSGNETGNSIQRSSSGDVYLTGGTSSENITGFNGVETTSNGGLSDGYLLRLNANSGNIINSTFVGSSGYDQVYFVQLDQSDNVYVYGQTDTDLTITPGLYGTPNSGQFIRKFNSTLSSIEWTTMIGAGSGSPEISPTAFLVSNCDEIYLAGWGGEVNQFSQAVNSSTNGFETTADAFQSQTNGSNFYIAVLEKDALGLKYGTFMGGMTSSSNHVDGGTSRFDKNGMIYHAVCAACGGDPNGFSSTQNVYSPTNQSATGCNMAAFKFELNSVQVDMSSYTPTFCLNEPNVFFGLTSNGNSFYWDFGDGNFSTEHNPSHTYGQAGIYNVSLTISDTVSCIASKTEIFEIEVLDLEVGLLTIDSVYCLGIDSNLEAYGGDTYSWSPQGLFSNSNISNPTINIIEDTTIQLKIQNACVQDSFIFYLQVSSTSPILVEDTLVCEQEIVQLWIQNSLSQVWSPSTFLDDPYSSNPIAIPSSSILYNVEVTTFDGCIFNEEVNIYVNPKTINTIVPQEFKDTSICIGDILIVQLENTLSQEWTPESMLDDPLSDNPSITVDSSLTLYVTVKTIDQCYLRDSLKINVFYEVPDPVLTDSILFCIGDSVNIKLNGAQYYDYSMNSNYDIILLDSLDSYSLVENYFYCNFINACGSHLDSILLRPIVPNLIVHADTILCPGEKAYLWADSMSVYTWYSNSDYLSDSSNISVSPKSNSEYIVVGEDEFGCLDTANVLVNLFEPPRIRIMDDYLASLDEEIKLKVFTNNVGTYEWFPKDYLSCYSCDEPTAIPNKELTYMAIFTDTNGCKVEDFVRVYYDGILYVPNSFTPNVDGKFNTKFSAEGLNILEYQMLIFDRWGSIVHETSSLNEMWDGTFEGGNCQTGTYIWKISYKDITGNEKELVGHVNLLR